MFEDVRFWLAPSIKDKETLAGKIREQGGTIMQLNAVNAMIHPNNARNVAFQMFVISDLWDEKHIKQFTRYGWIVLTPEWLRKSFERKEVLDPTRYTLKRNFTKKFEDHPPSSALAMAGVSITKPQSARKTDKDTDIRTSKSEIKPGKDMQTTPKSIQGARVKISAETKRPIADMEKRGKAKEKRVRELKPEGTIGRKEVDKTENMRQPRDTTNTVVRNKRAKITNASFQKQSGQSGKQKAISKATSSTKAKKPMGDDVEPQVITMDITSTKSMAKADKDDNAVVIEQSEETQSRKTQSNLEGPTDLSKKARTTKHDDDVIDVTPSKRGIGEEKSGKESVNHEVINDSENLGATDNKGKIIDKVPFDEFILDSVASFAEVKETSQAKLLLYEASGDKELVKNVLRNDPDALKMFKRLRWQKNKDEILRAMMRFRDQGDEDVAQQLRSVLNRSEEECTKRYKYLTEQNSV